MNPTVKRYLFSSLVTFFAGFAVAVLPEINKLSLAELQSGALWGVGFVGIRAGVKALLEWLVAWYGKLGPSDLDTY